MNGHRTAKIASAAILGHTALSVGHHTMMKDSHLNTAMQHHINMTSHHLNEAFKGAPKSGFSRAGHFAKAMYHSNEHGNGMIAKTIKSTLGDI